MAALEPLAISALEALGAARTPEPGVAERAWLQMQQRIVDGPAPLELASVPRPRRAAAWLAISSGAVALAAAAVVVLGWGPRAMTDTDDHAGATAPYSTKVAEPIAPDEAPQDTSAPIQGVTQSDTVTPSEVPAGIEPAVAPTTPPRATKPVPARRRDPVEPAVIPTIEPDDPKPANLAAEMRLLAKANAAMRAGDPSRALGLLDEHARSFASGQLAPERDYQRAVALCELGRTDAARSVAASFAGKHPSSPLRAKAKAVCAG